jgi:solute carrier family 35 protein E1
VLVLLWIGLSRLLLSIASPESFFIPGSDASLAVWQRTAQGLILCGTSHFIYNYSSFAFLAATSPITHSVANCMRRVFVVGISLIYFRNPVSPLAAFGTAVALAGVWLFTHVKNSSKARPSLLPTVADVKSV